MLIVLSKNMQLHLIADKLYYLLTPLILLTINAINLHYQELAGCIMWLYIQIPAVHD